VSDVHKDLPLLHPRHHIASESGEPALLLPMSASCFRKRTVTVNWSTRRRHDSTAIAFLRCVPARSLSKKWARPIMRTPASKNTSTLVMLPSNACRPWVRNPC
jgi:hypothetical protein